jgi:predicted Zn-dependent protease
MASKSRKQQILEMLAEDPTDVFLRYGLAMEHASAGEHAEAVRCFQDLIRDKPDYVPAYVQAGQVLARLGREDEARSVFRAGIEAARKTGDLHAAGEMESFLEGLG